MSLGQSDALTFLRHGQTPLFRLPITRAEGQALDDVARGADAVIVGVPWDGGTTLHPGARHAPFAIRQQSVLLSGYHPQLDVDVFDAIDVRDGGNIALTPFSSSLLHEAVASEVASVLAAGATPFLIGGDHSITLPALRAAARHHGPVALLHVDAHADTSPDEAWMESHHHGTWLRHVLNEGLVAEGALIQVGIRGPFKARDELRCVEAAGGVTLTADDIATRGTGVIRSLLDARCGTRKLWISFDIDAVDPAFAPGTGARVCGGLDTREALRIVRSCVGRRLAGFDIVEVCPSLDVGHTTALLAAHLLFEGLAVHARTPR